MLRAVDLGSPALVGAVLGKDPARRLPAEARARLLAPARAWYETGAVGELRRRTGADGPADRVPVREDYADVEQVSLGGLTVRAGHGAVLTEPEWTFRVLTPVDEPVVRAVRHRDELHVGRSACLFALGDAAAGFLLDAPFLRQGGSVEYEEKETELLAAWTSTEQDDEVLATLLEALDGWEHPGEEAIGPRHAEHPDPRVRRAVPNLLAPR
ncbi:hypothetical protein [Kitasatospora sp. NPDC096204]|uniref:hypothetical protein n=1 Tax=Kitasatospora sp. NPDC096204 TaxID=3364094 RepID=UPI0038191034